MNAIAQYFDGRADEWDRTFNRKSPVQEAVATIAGVSKGSHVLDLGCGTGIMADVYLDLKASHVVAVDISSRMIEIARSKYENENRIRFTCCDALEFECEEQFDAVVIYNAYPHFLDKPALAEHVKTLLKPNGRFAVAHSMGREHMNAHHSTVPASVTSVLLPAATEAETWKPWFEVDTLVDCQGFYCFAGNVRRACSSVATAAVSQPQL